jgi:hypothetical protein
MPEQIRYVETGDRQEEVRVSQHGGVERHEHIIRDKAAERNQVVRTLTQFVWLITGIVEVLIGLRFVLKLIAANSENPFAQLIYNITYLFVWPFLGLTATPASGGIVLEIPSLIAMVVYLLLAWGVASLLQLFAGRSSTRSVSVYERDH